LEDETMKKGRRNHGASFKAKVALEAVRGEKSLAEIASQYQVHPGQVRKWRKQLLEELPEIFTDKRRRARESEQHEARLYEEIGRLKVELDWLQKKLES